jgi:hypothetical protein
MSNGRGQTDQSPRRALPSTIAAQAIVAKWPGNQGWMTSWRAGA